MSTMDEQNGIPEISPVDAFLLCNEIKSLVQFSARQDYSPEIDAALSNVLDAKKAPRQLVLDYLLAAENAFQILNTKPGATVRTGLDVKMADLHKRLESATDKSAFKQAAEYIKTLKSQISQFRTGE